ncbi:MAG: hypothetical protein COW65_04900 [Cytophagales bacterium CG18_big_fil_WC_8_21_14_2_50_42_9]|nr:MAG: hypothetical protein COW65_04900 [Cytophagales bacterium CG18_big_fil_WC_8_21_14_2_50_42_9]
MNPTPPTAPGNGVATLMAEIERIAQELRAYNKRPLPATEDQLQALVKLAERDRPLTLHVNSEAVAQQLVGKVELQAKLFRDTGNELLTYLDNRQRMLTSALDERVAALKAAEVSLQATTDRMPKQVPLNVMANWRSTVGFTFGPVLLVLLTMLFTGHFSRVPKAEVEAVQAKYDHLLGVAQAVGAERDYYQGQIEKFRKEMGTNKAARKTSQYFFPAYVPAPLPKTKR